jgi:serine/threonine protein kinase
VEYTHSIKPGGERHFIVEEFVPGTDLSALLKPEQQWSLDQTSRFFAELCDGLSALEKLNIVHRDLKPSNIRVRNGTSPVIIDFGLARHLDQPDITSTRDGARLGTPMYYSPEQWTGTKHDIDHRTDLFAIGILLYQALVGFHPFHRLGLSNDQLSIAVCESYDYIGKDRYTRLPDKWKNIIDRLMRKERAERPHSATQLASIFRQFGGLSASV